MLKQPSSEYRGFRAGGIRLREEMLPQLGKLQAWWMPLFPGAAIFLTVLSFNLAGEALNEMLDPRARTAL